MKKIIVVIMVKNIEEMGEGICEWVCWGLGSYEGIFCRVSGVEKVEEVGAGIA